ncbi:MAG TPA: hypothetical protein VFP61_03710 [Acidimicrobiales bacterium]|nr:hypothetical protein [Acidimicrobiales bacterium]
MTKLPSGAGRAADGQGAGGAAGGPDGGADGGQAAEGATVARCAWCGRRFVRAVGPGRPRRFCRRSCRQRDFEARQRVREVGLAEGELVVTRRALSTLDDLAYVLACAVDDVERQLVAGADPDEVRDALDWLLEAARPLADRSRSGSVLAPSQG